MMIRSLHCLLAASTLAASVVAAEQSTLVQGPVKKRFVNYRPGDATNRDLHEWEGGDHWHAEDLEDMQNYYYIHDVEGWESMSMSFPTMPPQTYPPKGKGYYKGKGYWKGKGKGWKKKKKKNNVTTSAPNTLAPSGPVGTPSPTPSDFTAPPTPECNSCSADCISIARFVLVDADQPANLDNPDEDVVLELEDGGSYSLSAIQASTGVTNFALLCIPDPAPPFGIDDPRAIGSVGLRDNNFGTHIGTAGYNSGLDYNSETNPPYTLADDNDGDFFPTNLAIGEEWSITCQAFCEPSLQGEASDPVTIEFTMLE